jgi:hypothetical protein
MSIDWSAIERVFRRLEKALIEEERVEVRETGCGVLISLSVMLNWMNYKLMKEVEAAGSRQHALIAAQICSGGLRASLIPSSS